MMGAPAFASVGPVGNIAGNGNLSIVSGNSVYAPVSIPVNACGVGLAILGFSNANCVGAASFDTFGLMPWPPARRRKAPDTRWMSGAFAVAILVTATTPVRYPRGLERE
jgi:hypothetical protein